MDKGVNLPQNNVGTQSISHYTFRKKNNSVSIVARLQAGWLGFSSQ